MRRLAFLAAASLAFIAISEPVAAHKISASRSECQKCFVNCHLDRNSCREICNKKKVRCPKSKLEKKKVQYDLDSKKEN